jgi:regulator of ribonuclease activity A
MPLSTADLSDEHDNLHVAEPIFRIFGRHRAFHGPIATVKCYEDNSRVREALEEPGEGRVLVVDGGGSTRRALMGDMLGALAVENGWAGVVVNGCIRDSDAIDELDLGVRAVSFAGVTFRPGEHLYADADGIVVAPVPVADRG